MATSARTQQIDDLMEEASQALAATRYFEAERLAVEALGRARSAQDFPRLARILLPLQEARRQRYQQALDVDREVVIIDEPFDEEHVVEPGLYLIQPPMVGADARRLRMLAQQQEVPIAVICREPTTLLGMCPIVTIAPGTTVRMKVDLPDDEEAPDHAWFAETMEELGDFAVDAVDAGLAPIKRLDLLLGRLEAIPEHERLHQATAEVCQEAQAEAEAEK